MFHTQLPMLEKLAIASQLTPPPSPDSQLKPTADGKGSFERSSHKLPQFLLLPTAANDRHLRYTSKAPSYSGSRSVSTREKNFENYLSEADNPISITEPVSPLSSTYSDRTTSFDISRPASFLPESTSTISEPYNRTSTTTTTRCDYFPEWTEDVNSSTSGGLAHADTFPTHSNSHQPSCDTPVAVPRYSGVLTDLTPRSKFDQVDPQRSNKIKSYEKELPPPPPAGKSSKELSEIALFQQTKLAELPRSDLGSILGFEGNLPTAEWREGTGPARASSKDIDNSSILTSRHAVIPQPSPISRAFPGVTASLNKVQPTYTVTVTAPKLSRRFSKLSTKSKDSSIDPLSPVNIIPQKSNGVETGAIAYLPRYTNTFAGFCKNAWRLQINEVDKALNVRNRNSFTVAPSFKCRKCAFEGPLQPISAPNSRFGGHRKIPDTRIRTAYGISYTWPFLFKSHVTLKKKAQKDFDFEMSEGLFACIFCCAKGKGTPVFKGPEALMWHMRTHAGEGDAIDRELEIRFKIIIGRSLEEGDVFDLFVPPAQTSAADDETY